VPAIGFYFPERMSNEEVNQVRRRLNEVAAELGYAAKRGPTKGQGNAAALLMAIASGEVNVIRDDSRTTETTECLQT
jgi:hypothetical protein